MTRSRSESDDGGAPAVDSPPRPAERSRERIGPAAAKAAAFLAVAAGAAYLIWRDPETARSAWRSVVGRGHARPARPEAAAPPSSRPWDGVVVLTEAARAAMGIRTEEVRPQTEPIHLELLGTSEYISDALAKIRPMFKGRVDRVHATIGQAVKKGDPLIDLYSADLAEAKSNYQIERIQWLYDRNLLAIRESLLKSKTVSQQLYDETKNNEMKNRREFEVARDKLLVYGLTDAEVEAVEEESGANKARLTLRAPIGGLVIDRDVAVGNIYDENDTLLVITPMDRLWVWGNVFESDLDLVDIGQEWKVHFPFLEHTLEGRVEYISNRVDPATHAVRVRTSIPNPDGKLKSDMLVRGVLEIPSLPGRVVVPRTALIVGDGHAFVFIEVEGASGRFDRRPVVVVKETDDRAILDRGVKAGERVVVVGGLVLAQMYENARAAAGGAEGAASNREVD